MRLWMTALAAGCSFLALTSTAQAQAIARHVTIEGQVTVLHDDNVARSGSAIAAARGLDRGDTIISPSLVADIYLPVSRQSVFFAGSIARDYYQNNSILNSLRTHLDGGVNLNVAFCQGVTRAGYGRGQSDLQDLDIGVTRNIEETTSAAINLTCGRSIGLAPTFGYSVSTSSNSNPLLVPSDYHSESYSYGLAYRRPSLGVVSLYGSHDSSDYRHRMILVGGAPVEDGFETDGFGIRYDRHLGARIGGEIEFGYTKVKPNIPTLNNFKGATYKAAIDFRASSRISANLSLAHGVSATIRENAAYSVDQTVQLGATYTANSRLNFSGGISDGVSHYKGAALTAGNLTRETIKAIYGGARWDVGRRIAFASSFRHEDRNSNLAGFDYTDNQISVTAIGKF